MTWLRSGTDTTSVICKFQPSSGIHRTVRSDKSLHDSSRIEVVRITTPYPARSATGDSLRFHVTSFHEIAADGAFIRLTRCAVRQEPWIRSAARAYQEALGMLVQSHQLAKALPISYRRFSTGASKKIPAARHHSAPRLSGRPLRECARIMAQYCATMSVVLIMPGSYYGSR